MKKMIITIVTIIAMVSMMSSCISAVEFARIWSDNEHPSYLSEYAGDGNTDLFWHTNWENGITEPPFTIFFELDGMYNISSLGFLPRQDGNLNGLMYEFNIYVSEDGENYTLVKEVTDFINDTEIQTVTFDSPVKAKFIEIEAFETEGSNFASLNELEVTGELVIESAEPEVVQSPEKIEVPAPVVEIAEAPPAAAETNAPETYDMGILLLSAMIFAFGTMVFVKKNSNRHSV